MSYFLLLLGSLAGAALAYAMFHFVKLKWPVSSGTLSLMTGLLIAVVLFTVFPHESAQKDPHVIIVGTSGDFPPFTFIQDGKPIGFDVDLVEEIGKRLDKKIEIKKMPFGTLLPALQLGVIQIIASGLTATPERAKQVLFTTPYLENNPLVIVSLSSARVNNVQDLDNKEVIVNEGYTADLYMSNIQGPHVKRLKSPAEAFLALESGRSFAFVTAQNTVKPFFDRYGAQRFHVAVIPNTEENASLAVTPGNPELLTQIQIALGEIKKTGILQKLRKKWGL